MESYAIFRVLITVNRLFSYLYRLTRGVKRQWRKTGSVPLKPEKASA